MIKLFSKGKEYNRGIVDGFVDSCTIDQPHNTNGHTFEYYSRVKSKYLECIYSFNPTEYQAGYGLGVDLGAIYLGRGGQTRA